MTALKLFELMLELVFWLGVGYISILYLIEGWRTRK